MATILKQFIDEFDVESDEIINKTIQEEYYFMLNYSLLYPWLKPFYYAIGRFVHLFIHHVYHIIVIVCCIITAYLSIDDFIVAGSLINYGIITLTFEIILFQIILNRKNMARVHRIIGQGVYDYNEDTPVVIEEIAIKAKYKSLIRWAKIIIPSMSMLGGIILLLIGPLIDSIVGVEKKTGMENLVNYDLPIPFWMPFDSTGPYTYWLSVILLALTVNTSIFVFISFNTVYFTVCLHIACHLEILMLSVKNIELRAKTYFTRNNQSDKKEIHIEGLYKDKDFIKMFEACLKKNIQHHQVILRFFRTAADIFYNPIFTFYFLVGFMIALASCAAISVTGQPGGVLNFVDIAVIQLLNVAVTCKMGQKLTDLNMQFRMELYSTNWYQYDKTITSLIIIVQEFTYRDMVIEAPFNFAANMETLAAVTFQRKNMARVHRIIGQGVFDYNEDTAIVNEEIAIKTKYKSLIRWAKIIFPSMSLFGGCVLLLFGPLIDSIAGVEKKIHSENGVNYDLPVPFWMPYNSTGPVSYWLTVLSLVLSVNSSIFVFISFNIVYFTVCLHIACHLEILILSMKNTESRAKILFQQKYNRSCGNEFHVDDLYKDKDFIKCLELCFKKNIQHHQVILRLHRASTAIFRNPIFTFYFMVGFMIALASYAAISVTGQPGGVINFVDLAVVEMLNVALTCKVGQNLTDLNTEFRIELYSTNWYQHAKKVTKLITIVQEFTYRDLVIEAPFSFAANMKTFAGVLNTTYSYFSLILAWASKTNNIN